MTKPRKTVYLIMRITEEMRAAVDRLAYKAGLSNSEFVRRALEKSIAQAGSEGESPSAQRSHESADSS